MLTIIIRQALSVDWGILVLLATAHMMIFSWVLHIIAIDSQEGLLYCIHTVQVTCVDDNYSSGLVR